MSSDTFRLWGFDGELKGNEERLQARLPMFTREGSDEVFLANKLDWAPELPVSDVVRMSVEQAEEAGERLEVRGSALAITPGRYVVVAGPKMRRHMFQLGMLWLGHPVQDGFNVKLMDGAFFKHYSAGLEKLAMRKFDIAIASGKASDAARVALAVMRNVGADSVRPQLVRTLALHFLAGETDQYLRVLRLGAKRLQDDPEQLKKEMLEHLEFVKQSPPFTFFARRVGDQPPAVERVPAGAGKTFYPFVNTIADKVHRHTAGSAKYGRHTAKGVYFPHLSKVRRGIRLSDLETTRFASRIDSKKLTHWIVSEE